MHICINVFELYLIIRFWWQASKTDAQEALRCCMNILKILDWADICKHTGLGSYLQRFAHSYHKLTSCFFHLRAFSMVSGGQRKDLFTWHWGIGARVLVKKEIFDLVAVGGPGVAPCRGWWAKEGALASSRHIQESPADSWNDLIKYLAACRILAAQLAGREHTW